MESDIKEDTTNMRYAIKGIPIGKNKVLNITKLQGAQEQYEIYNLVFWANRPRAKNSKGYWKKNLGWEKTHKNSSGSKRVNRGINGFRCCMRGWISYIKAVRSREALARSKQFLNLRTGFYSLREIKDDFNGKADDSDELTEEDSSRLWFLIQHWYEKITVVASDLLNAFGSIKAVCTYIYFARDIICFFLHVAICTLS